MSDHFGESPGTLVTSGDSSATALLPSSPNPNATSPTNQGREAYIQAARIMLPSWLRLVGPTPWFSDHIIPAGHGVRGLTLDYHQQAATLAMALLGEHDRAREDKAYLHEVVRTSLAKWQLTMYSDGRPIRRQRRTHALHTAMAAQVCMILTETSGYHNRMLIDDLQEHINWLSKKSKMPPWLEAALLTCMVDVSVLAGKHDWLTRARLRLKVLLKRQDEEGWFPENGGTDLGRLSLTVDSLGRLFHQTAWPELEKPLESALSFMLPFVQPDGLLAGCNGSGACSFFSPYGAELLAHDFPQAAALARIGRMQCANDALVREWSASEGPAAIWGAGVMLAASIANDQLPVPAQCPYEEVGDKEQQRFPNAGVTIFSNETYHAVVAGRCGGAMRLVWRQDQKVLNEPALTVVYPHSVRGSGQALSQTHDTVTHTTVTSHDTLRKLRTIRTRHPGKAIRLARWFNRIKRRVQGLFLWKTNHQPFRLKEGSAIVRDRVLREITFGDNWIRIQDRVHCALSCETIVCRSPWPHPHHPPEGYEITRSRSDEPIFVEGGRRVSIVRLYRNGELVKPGCA